VGNEGGKSVLCWGKSILAHCTWNWIWWSDILEQGRWKKHQWHLSSSSRMEISHTPPKRPRAVCRKHNHGRWGWTWEGNYISPGRPNIPKARRGHLVWGGKEDHNDLADNPMRGWMRGDLGEESNQDQVQQCTDKRRKAWLFQIEVCCRGFPT